MEGNGETRKDFLTKKSERTATGVLLGNLRDDIAAKKPAAVCSENEPTDSSLTQACRAKEMEKEEKCEMVEAMRSAPAFEELAEKLPDQIDLKDRRLTVLYPASGSHLAPLVLASRLIDSGHIDEAVFTFTEIEGVTMEEITKNLISLCALNPNFKFTGPKEFDFDSYKDYLGGAKYSFPLEYKGKKIRIDMLIDCCGEKLFSDEVLKGQKVVISHDSVDTGTRGDLQIMNLIFDSCKRRNMPLPAIIMGDSNRVAESRGLGFVEEEYARRFDMDTLGQMSAVSKKPYGHRTSIDCEGVKELGKPIYERAGIYKIDQAVFNALNPEEFLFLGNVLYRVKNTGDRVKSIEGGQIFETVQFYRDVIERMPVILEKLKKTNPKIAKAVAYRTIQFLYLFFVIEDDGFLNRDAIGSSVHLKASENFVGQLEANFERKDLPAGGKYLDQIRKSIAAIAKSTREYDARLEETRDIRERGGTNERMEISDSAETKYQAAVEKARPSKKARQRIYEEIDKYGDLLFR